MVFRRSLLLLAAGPLLLAAASAPVAPESEPVDVALERARSEALAAEAEMRLLEQAAASARDEAAKLAAERQAAAAAIAASEARISAADAELCLPAAAAYELELVLHQGTCFARDLSGGRTFKSGAPLGTEWSPVNGGEMLLISSGALLRFEDA